MWEEPRFAFYCGIDRYKREVRITVISVLKLCGAGFLLAAVAFCSAEVSLEWMQDCKLSAGALSMFGSIVKIKFLLKLHTPFSFL